MPFITQGKANLKYILIVVILSAIVGGGILAYQFWWLPKQEIESPEVKPSEGVFARTNKSTYYQHVDLDSIESIEVSLKNNLKEIIFSDGIANTEKKSQDGSWEKLSRESCVPPTCIDELRIPAEIKPGESKVVDGISVDILDPGTYRFEIGYYLKKETLQEDQSQKTVLSNKFIVHPEMLRAKFTGKFSEETIDINANGLYDFLIINVEINVTTSGKYYIHGYLSDFYYESPLTILKEGIHSMPLRFDGQSIRYAQTNGPYYLHDLYLETEDDNTTDILFLEIKNEKGYETKPYRFVEFEPLFAD